MAKYTGVIDRIEGRMAVVEITSTLWDEIEMMEYPKSVFGKRPAEGQVYTSSNLKTWKRNTKIEKQRLAHAKAVLDELRRRDPGGDITI